MKKDVCIIIGRDYEIPERVRCLSGAVTFSYERTRYINFHCLKKKEKMYRDLLILTAMKIKPGATLRESLVTWYCEA